MHLADNRNATIRSFGIGLPCLDAKGDGGIHGYRRELNGEVLYPRDNGSRCYEVIFEMDAPLPDLNLPTGKGGQKVLDMGISLFVL